MKKADTVIEIRPVNLVKTRMSIVGDSPLIMHAWSEKAKRLMLEAQTKTAKTKKAREIRKPFEEFVDSMYWLTGMPENKDEEGFVDAIQNGAKFGFPVTAIKQAAIASAYRSGSVKDMVSLRGAFFLNGLDVPDFVTIKSDVPEMREDMVKIGMGTADLRYRGEFKNWRADMVLTFNDNGVFSLDHIVNAINLGGFMCGIGEWRPERDGQFGMYHVDINEEE